MLAGYLRKMGGRKSRYSDVCYLLGKVWCISCLASIGYPLIWKLVIFIQNRWVYIANLWLWYWILFDLNAYKMWDWTVVWIYKLIVILRLKNLKTKDYGCYGACWLVFIRCLKKFVLSKMDLDWSIWTLCKHQECCQRCYCAI